MNELVCATKSARRIDGRRGVCGLDERRGADQGAESESSNERLQGAPQHQALLAVGPVPLGEWIAQEGTSARGPNEDEHCVER